MKVVSFSIFKGGTGKTSSSVNAAVSLARKGKKVLLVDLDQQASATRYLDLDPDNTPNLAQDDAHGGGLVLNGRGVLWTGESGAPLRSARQHR